MTTTVSRPPTAADIVVLQYANRNRMILVPLGILVAVVIVMTGVTIAVVLSGGSGDDLDSSGIVVWSFTGFIVAMGVQAVSSSFPLALGLGSTRRAFTGGLLATAALQSGLLTVAALVLLGLELLTNGWFVGARVLGDSTLGGGNPLDLVAVMFLLALSALSVGGLFGASWVRFGARGPQALGIALSVIAVAVLLISPPDFMALGRAFQPWWLAIAAAVVVVLSTAGEYLLLRRASVR